MNRFFILLSAAVILFSCQEKITTTDPTPEPVTDEYIVLPEKADADGPCTLYFNPTANSSVSSALYGYTGDVYVHIGLYYDDDWQHVVASWNENKSKCKMERLGDNSYKLEIGPSIREYFGSGTTPVEKLAVVFRSADGSKQTRPDLFFPLTDTKYATQIFTPDPVVKATMPQGMKHGINYGSDNSVTFVLYDLSRSNKCHDYVYLIGEFNGWERKKDYMMKRDDEAGCWWYTLSDVNPDKEYMFQYHVGDGDSSFRIHDPYCEVVYDPWNDKYISSSTYPNLPSYPDGTKDIVGAFKVNTSEYNWQVKDFKISDENNLVIYELHFRDFTSTHDINGALEKLDYLKNLGVGAIELMPIQEFDGNDSWGYNPHSYFALDKAYGTREMYKKFIDECHLRGMAVILDVVYNHTTGSGPMAKLWWNNATNNVSSDNPLYLETAPHDLSFFHDIDHQSPVVREHIKRNLEYLMNEYKVDGFRFDFTKGFTNNRGKDNAYDQQRVDVLKEYGACIKAVNPSAIVIFEHFVDAENSALNAAGLHVWGNCNGAYRNVVKGTNSDLGWMYDSSFCRVGYMESHDEERVSYVPDMDLDLKMRRAALAAAYTLLVPGAKMIWQFGELGYDYSINYNGDNVASKPIKWDYFDVPERKALYDTYAALIKFRKDCPEFFTKGAQFTANVSSSNFSGGKFLFGTASDKHFCVMGNFDTVAKDITINLPMGAKWKDAFTSTLLIDGVCYTENLKPGEFRVLIDFDR